MIIVALIKILMSCPLTPFDVDDNVAMQGK